MIKVKFDHRYSLLAVALLLILTTGCRSNSTTNTTAGSSAPATTPAYTSTAPSSTPPQSISTPPATSLTATTPTSVEFDFDSGSPALKVRQNTPLDQTASGLTAHFSSSYDPGGFSIQNQGTTFYTLSQFSGNYLYDSSSLRNTLTIKFDHPLTSISLTFATIDYHDPGAGGVPSNIKLTAYTDSMASTPIGSVTAHGTFSGDSYPQGILSLHTPQSLNLVTIELPYLAQGAVDFLVDNIIVTIA